VPVGKKLEVLPPDLFFHKNNHSQLLFPRRTHLEKILLKMQLEYHTFQVSLQINKQYYQ
jgi:hypothetical protein